jgi:tripartite-type tricarboxylate transporter receptor subunit TctC
VVVENKLGANGNIGTEAAVGAKPDGYTLLIHSSSAVLGNPFIMKDTHYDPLTDLQPVSSLFEVGFILVVPPHSKIGSVADLTAYLKAKKGDTTYGSPNLSSLASANQYLNMIGASGIRVNYKAMIDAAADITAGQLDMVFGDSTVVIAQAKQGRLKPLAATSKRRIPGAPDVPTMVEAGLPGYDYSVFWGAWLPKDTPKEVGDKISGWLKDIVAAPATQEFLARNGAIPMWGPPSELGTMMKSGTEKLAEIVKAAKIERQ